jgi:hypothetical protein
VGKFLLNDADKAELILSPSHLLTPQLLFNSGIAKVVASLTHRCRQNLQDHPATAVFTTEIESAASSRRFPMVADEMEDYLVRSPAGKFKG